MNKFFQWIGNIMKQSNRPDDLSRFLLKAGVIIGVLGVVFSNKLLLWLGFSAIIILYIRIFSKDKQRYYQENQTYLKYKNRFLRFFQKKTQTIQNKKNTLKQKKTHRFYKCPECGQKVRIPKGRGKVTITCPSCGNKFVKKS